MEIKDRLLYPLILSIGFFFLYLFFSAPTIVFGDSPELILASYSLGIAHPPGYPAYSLLSRAFYYLFFFVNYAKSINIFSAFTSSLTIFIFYKTLRKFDINILIALLCSLSLGFSEILFKQSVVAEVYSLNNLFFSISLFCFVGYMKDKDPRSAYLLFFISGVGLGNHHTLISIIFAAFVYFFLIERRFSLLIPSVIFLMFGFSVYLYLPLRSITNPLLDWGNPEDLKSFLDVLLRKQFGFGNQTRDFKGFIEQISLYLSFLNDQLWVLLIILMLPGIYFIAVRLKINSLPFFIIFLVNGILTPLALNSTSEDFFLVKEFLTPSVMAALIFISFGTEIINRSWSKYLLLSIFLFTICYKFYYDIDWLDKRKDFYAYKLSKDSIESAPHSAFIIGESDYTLFPLWYLQNVEGLRKDLTILDADFLMLPWYQEQNIKRLPILKELIPDISGHAKSRKGSFLDDAVLEGFKLDQAALLARNINDRLSKEVFLTYDFYEMAKAYKPELIKSLKQYGVLYHLASGKELLFNPKNFDLTIFLQKIRLPKEEQIFLNPYVPYLIEKAEEELKQMNFKNAVSYLENAYLLDPAPEKALYLAFALAEANIDLERAEQFAIYADKLSRGMLPRINLTKGVIYLRKNRLNEAFTFLSREDNLTPLSCQPKLYLLELFLKAKDMNKASEIYQFLIQNCDDYIKKRAGLIFQKR